jgi:excinuclease UvrABC ATPase subunit
MATRTDTQSPASRLADSHDLIRVHGARVNNLKDVSVEIPKRRLTAFTGVSGSGKSSLVFGTIAAESQRLINETYSAFLQGFMPTLARPEVDVLDGLTTAIIVDQERMGADARSTVGTVTDANAMLRILFSRLGKPHIGSPQAFSFNVDLGPRAGSEGGEVVFEGTVEGLRAGDTLTGHHLDDRASLKPSVRASQEALEVRGAATNNLQDVDVDIPLGVLVVITGVAGSGKSSLIDGSVSGRDGVVTVDQTAIRGSRRSNPATYSKLLDPIRKAFAKANGVKPGLFSANSDGACPNCNGAGVIYTDLAMMAGVATTCEECGGKRFQAEVLEYKFGGVDISEVLAMSVTEAEEFFGDGEARTPAAHKILDRLADVGLGYLRIGQPLTTLSGGERQRLKLATQMGARGGVYVLDEPTTGLHLADVEQLLGLLDELVDSGKSAIVIEHHQAVMAHADWIIDLGPGAGHDGGRIVFEGTPIDLVAARSTLTGEHLAAYVGS